MRIETKELQRVLSIASKGAGMNSFMPLTCFCQIQSTDGFEITTTDGDSILTVKGKREEEIINPFNCVVDLKKFHTLIMKLTSKIVTLSVVDTNLRIDGNGSYVIELPLDENDNLVEFVTKPNYEELQATSLYADIFREVIRCNRGSLPKSLDIQDLNGYMFDTDSVITSDTLVICSTPIKTFSNRVMFSPNVVSILGLFDDEITVHTDGNLYVFSENDMTYYTHKSSATDRFPIDSIRRLLSPESTSFTYNVIVNSSELHDAIVRISLFASPYDANACSVTIDFDENVMLIKNKYDNCVERVPIVFVNDYSGQYTFMVNYNFITNQLKTMQKDVVLKFGNDSCIELVDDMTCRIIALID